MGLDPAGGWDGAGFAGRGSFLPSSLPSPWSVLAAADLLDFFAGAAKAPLVKQVTRQAVSNNRVVEWEANFMIVHLYRALQPQGNTLYRTSCYDRNSR